MSKKNALGFVLFACLALYAFGGSVPSAEAATYWASTTGSGGNACSAVDGDTDPGVYRTITTVGSCMAPGDTAIVKAGTYVTSGVAGSLPNGISSTQMTLMRSENTTGTAVAQTLDVTLRVDNNNSDILSFVGKSFVEIRGFVIDQGNGAANGVSIEGGSNKIRLRNCEIKNISGNQGILIQNNSPNNEFIDLNVHHVGPTDYEHGGYMSSDGNLVQGGEWHDNKGQGIQFTNSASSDEPDYNTVVGAKFYNNGVYAVVIRGINPQVYNTMFYDNSEGIFVAGSGGKVINNTFFSNNGTGITIGNAGNSAAGITVQNNILWQNGGTISNGGSGTILSSNLTSSDPLFVSTSPVNLKLQAGSPAIGVATARSEFSTDFEGQTRSAPWDLGADEFGGSSSTPPPPTFDFSLNNGGARTVVQGSSASNSVTANLTSGTSQSISFTTSGLPNGSNASYVPSSCLANCTTTLTINTTSSTPAGTYTVVVSGSAGALVRTTSFSLTVSSGATPPPPQSTISLANSTTLVSSSQNIDGSYSLDNLWDGCTDESTACTTAARAASFWAEFDLQRDYTLTSAQLFGDDVDAWYSSTWKLEYRRTAADPWTTAFSNVNAKLNGWSVPALNVTARYVRVEIFGNASVPATEARELEILGTVFTSSSSPLPAPTNVSVK